MKRHETVFGQFRRHGMCALSPFCVLGGVMLQCGLQEINGDELPIAFICGAERIPAGSDDIQ